MKYLLILSLVLSSCSKTFIVNGNKAKVKEVCIKSHFELQSSQIIPAGVKNSNSFSYSNYISVCDSVRYDTIFLKQYNKKYENF